MNFFLLCRKQSKLTDNLQSVLHGLGSIHLIEDDVINDKEGFTGMCTHTILPDGKSSSAWDKAFIDIQPETSWFIEDDVAFNRSTIEHLIHLTNESDKDLSTFYVRSPSDQPDWPWWKKNEGYFENPVKSLNPICRIKGHVIEKILQFQKEHGHFIFHELLFANLAESYFDFKKETPSMFSHFAWRPALERIPLRHAHKVMHPIKAVTPHTKACHPSSIAKLLGGQ